MAGFDGPSFVAAHSSFPLQCSMLDGNPGGLGGFDAKCHAPADSSIGINDGHLNNVTPCESGVDSSLSFSGDLIPQDSGVGIKQVTCDWTFSPHETVADGGAGIPAFCLRWKNATIRQRELPA